MKTPLYFSSCLNFGDALNKNIFEKIGGIQVFKSDADTAAVVGIGSLLERYLLTEGDLVSTQKTRVFSSGFGRITVSNFMDRKIIHPQRFKHNMVFYALRGQLSLDHARKITGQPLTDVVLGDGGLLAHLLIDRAAIKPMYDLGIVPHYAESEHPVFKDIQSRIPNSVVLDVRQDPIAFLTQLAMCKAVISTAMHPLIACDAMGIPNLWARVSEETTSRFKFHDYYSALGAQKEPFDLSANSFTAQDAAAIVQNYDIDPKRVARVQRNLLTALRQLKEDLTADQHRIRMNRLRHFLFSRTKKKGKMIYTICGLKIKI